ncbi:UvrD-helicase domain-containing protein [Aquipuribacter sp. MA13-6]|uniref:UvrD-helicase domain-containing protein n=1 Tax=unclassified Aquipuribacter TaxID=2635084 RepID=UPI003EEE84D1
MPLSPADAPALLAPLDDEQRAVAEAVRGPVCVVAGAGTGKTRAITHRIAHAVAVGATAEDHVLAVTFTARAAGEMRERLRALGVGRATARTFHAAALRMLQHFWPTVVGGGAPSLLEHKAAVVGEAAARLGVRVDRTTVRDLSAELEWAKVGLLTPASYPGAAAAAGRGDVAGLDPSLVARLIEAYEDAKTARGVMDFEDVLLLTTAMLREREDVARQVRSRYRWFTVDEYQDVSAAQQQLLDAWVGERDDVCVVGDPNQTIYTFAGADASLLGGFASRHPGATVVQLVRNYRSRPAVVELGNGVLEGAGATPGAGRAGAVGGATAPSGTVRLRAVRPAADDPGGAAPGAATSAAGTDLGPPTFSEHDDDVAEAEAVAARVSALLGEGTAAADVAILVRTNGQLEVVEEALGAAGVPYLVRGGERFFARREVREAVVLLRGAAKGAHDRTDGPTADPDGRGTAPAEASALADRVADVLSGAGWSPEPPSGRGQVRDRWESLAALVDHARRLTTQRPDADLPDLVADLEARAAQQHAPVLDGVTLATMHAAKGLEWDVVMLPGLSEGLVPISLATTPAALEEERRLLYVGVTRAREVVHLSWARARNPGSRGARRPSRFLDAVRPGGGSSSPSRGDGARAAAPATGRERRRAPMPSVCQGCGVPLATAAQRTAGRCSDCPPRYDAAVHEALKAWRAATAAAAGVPAYVVFTDATLEAIADRHPTDVGALVGIAGVGSVKLGRYGPDVVGVVVAASGAPAGPG